MIRALAVCLETLFLQLTCNTRAACVSLLCLSLIGYSYKEKMEAWEALSFNAFHQRKLFSKLWVNHEIRSVGGDQHFFFFLMD